MKTSLVLSACLAAATATVGARTALAQEVVVQPAAPPPSTTVVVHERSESHPGLIWGGVALWAVSYAPAAFGAALGNDACAQDTRFCLSGRQVLYVPVAGPFIAIAGVNGFGSATLKTLLAFDGAFQAGGIGMMITGIVLSAGSARRTGKVEKGFVAEHKLVFAPLANAGTAGALVSGAF